MTKEQIIKLYIADLNNLVADSDAKRNRIMDLEDELEAIKQGQLLPIDSVSNCSQECEWKADTFDNIGMALTEYCEECGAKRDCC